MVEDIPIQHAPDEALADAVQENLFALFRHMAAVLPGAEIVESDRLGYHHSFPTNPMFKGVWRTRLKGEDADQAIEEAVAWFKTRQAPYFFWWTGTGTTPDDLPQRLQQRGFLDMAELMETLSPGIVATELGAPCMVADLTQLDESLLWKTPPDFTIEEVSTEAGLLDFKKVFIESYEIADFAGQGWVDASVAAGIDRMPWRVYVGYLSGKPVATNMLLLGAGFAGLYAVATLPETRRKGIGAAITLKPLLTARQKGYRYGVLFSSEMGISVYQRVGFRLTTSRINRYFWQNR